MVEFANAHPNYLCGFQLVYVLTGFMISHDSSNFTETYLVCDKGWLLHTQ